MIALETPSAASAQEIPQLVRGRPGHRGALFVTDASGAGATARWRYPLVFGLNTTSGKPEWKKAKVERLLVSY